MTQENVKAAVTSSSDPNQHSIYKRWKPTVVSQAFSSLEQVGKAPHEVDTVNHNLSLQTFDGSTTSSNTSSRG